MSGMEVKHKELLELHRAKFSVSVDVDRLCPILQGAGIITQNDVAEILSQVSKSAQVETLLDILPSKGSSAFQSLCSALESTYPHLLTVMFLGSNQKVTDSMSTSLTWDSEDEALRHSPQPGERQVGVASPTTYTRIIPSYAYDIQPQEEPSSTEHPVKSDPKLPSHPGDITKTRTNQKSVGMHEERQRDYDWLKSQCEKAMNELQALKRQHGDTVKRCDQAMKEADFYHRNYKSSVNKLDQATEEIDSVKARCNDVILEKNKLSQELAELRKLHEEDKTEIADLLKQQRDVISEGASSEVLKLYDSAQDKYEALRKDYDNLQKRFADQLGEYSTSANKLEFTMEENARLKKQYEDAISERNCALMERNGLKQQCTAAIRNWDIAIQERNKIKDEFEAVKIQEDSLSKELHQIVHSQLKAKQDFDRICDERNAALNEYKLVMSERDSVHKEIEQLQDRLHEAVKEVETLRADKKALQDEGESLRREISCALQDRDKALKEVNDLRERFGDVCSEKNEVQKERDEFRKDYYMVAQERDVARHERQEALVHRDQILRETYEKTAREKAEEMEQVAKETEALKKHIEKLTQDYLDSVQEADIAKKRRDWAFGERDKIVQERESIRTLCDKLRRERDRAVSDLAQALRDSDDLKKQKNEMYKELKEIRERCETTIEPDVRKSQLNSVSHNHSRDSAIDADLHEWETETLELDLGNMNSADLGFDLVGGKDDPQFHNDNSLFVSHISKGSAVYGKLRLNDLLVKVNNVDVTNVEKQAAFQAVINNSGVVNMVVRRKKSSNRSNQPVQISITLGKGHDDPGIQLENGLFISRISPNSSIAKDRALNLGDRILAVNGQTVEKMSIPAVLKVLGESYDSVVLDIWKPTSPMSSAGPSPTPPSQSSPRDLPTTPPMRKPLVQNHMWESTANCASSESKSTSNLKALKCSGSQTDSLDSPSPRKKHHEHKHDKDEKNRHSSHPDWLMIIKRFLPKNHEERERERLNKSNSGMSAAEENVIAEFENVLENYDLVKAKPSKPPEPIKGSDINNGGTWPKTHHSKLDFEGPGTVIQCPHGRRERSRLPPEFIHPRARNKIPPEPPERTNSSVDATFRHSPQNSDLSVKHSAPSLAAPPGSRQLPLISSQIKLPVSSSHSIGGHTPNSRGSHYPAYSTPVHSSEGGQRDLLSLYLDKKKMGRPTSAPGRGGDRRYHMAIPNLYPVPDNKPPSLDVHRLYPSPGPSYSPIRPAVSPTDFLPRGPDRPLPFGPHFHGKATSPINFPSSISPTFAKGPPSMISSYPGESSPISGQLMTSPSNVSQSMSASYCSSPPGGIPNMHYFRELSNPRIPELDRYHGPTDKRATISPSPSQQSNIALDRSTPTPSDDPYSQLYARPSPHGRPLPTYYDGRSTIPRRAQDRICIPSNASVLAKSSTGSVDYVPERGSPMSPMFPMDMSERASSTSLSSSLPMTLKPRKPLPGEQRTIIIEKTADVVGFQIKTGPNGGIFVSTVNENSLASQNGLEVGDQLIEVCGINMRNATKDLAASVLRQCRDTFAMVLQYNPDKFNGDSSESSNPSSPLMSHPSSPDPLQSSHRVSSETLTTQTAGGSNPVRHNANTVTEGVMEPRFVFLERSTPSMELGIEVIGGNAAGIFVHEVDPDSAAARPGGLQKGDHILEFNGVDLRSATLEQACSELSKGNSKVTILAQYNMAKYNNICPGMGDFFFIRTHFDRTAENEGELSFKKDDILLIETTRFKKVGVWFGWLVDDEGKKIKGGSIPSKFRLEDELVLRRSLSENLSLIEDDFRPGSRRGSNSVRRSIFRKRRHQRNNSKDSREFGSFSDASLNSDSVPVLDDGSLYTYTRVERVEYSMTRPVIILAPFAEPIILKLTSESPDKYCCCPTMEMSVQSIENALSSCQIIDYWKRDDHYECVSAAAVQNVCDKKCHCLLNTTPSAIERLRQLKIYPIVLFCRHKSAKQIREVRDVQFLSERISTKSSRDLFDQYHKLEQENRHLFTGIIQGGNLAEMCTQIKRVIATEQQKTIWVAAGSL